MKKWMASIGIAALAGGLALAGCDSPREDARERAFAEEEARLERVQETYEEWAEGRAETAAAQRGDNAILQEVAGMGAEELVDDVFDRHEERLDDLRDQLEDRDRDRNRD